MLPNADQTKSAVRWILAWFSGVVGGWLVAKGWSSGAVTTITSAIDGDTAVTMVVGLISLIWGLVAHRQTSSVASVAAMPGTRVSPGGDVIYLVDPKLAVAAQDAATDASGKKAA